MKNNIYKDKLEDKGYSGSGVPVDVTSTDTVVNSLNNLSGNLTIGINQESNDDDFVNLGIDATNIPISSPTSEDDNVPSVAESFSVLEEDVSTLGANVAAKKSVDTVGDTGVNKTSVKIQGASGITAVVDNTSSSQSIITLSTDSTVPKGFTVSEAEIITADVNHPYKFVSSDDSISITKTSTAGEIDLKALDTPTDSKYIFSEPLTTLVSKLLIGYQPTKSYFDNVTPFDFTVKSNTNLYPQTSDLILTAYYSDFIQRNPSYFPNGQGIFLIKGVPTLNPTGDKVNMLRIYIDMKNRNDENRYDLMISVVNPSTQTSSTYRLNTDLPSQEMQGPKVKINLSEIWSNTGYSLKEASFDRYMLNTSIEPFYYSLVCGHIYFSFQYQM
jgi:hypothetical protein